jgi:hypothetical protein
MTETAWKATMWKERAGRHVAQLTYGQDVVMTQVQPSHAKAWQCLADWMQQARAGLIEPVPERERIRRLALAPARLPTKAQQLQTDGLPLFGDARNQLNLVDLLR